MEARLVESYGEGDFLCSFSILTFLFVPPICVFIHGSFTSSHDWDISFVMLPYGPWWRKRSVSIATQ